MKNATAMTTRTDDVALTRTAAHWLRGALFNVQRGICPMCDAPQRAGELLCGAAQCAELANVIPAGLWNIVTDAHAEAQEGHAA